MSTVDPEPRWWRSGHVLRVTANVLWIVVFATTSITGWPNALYLAGAEWTHWAEPTG
ncbi:hypothetical protein [Streptomyces sp. NPDC050560]|uniref:hypothetical protein n=1 Tax=Streptomyces sp. NPDC050560 TaxID=3365630 RepID=UPI00379D10AE